MEGNRNRKERAIAAAVTFIIALALLLWLFIGGLTWNKEELAQQSTPEIIDEEPIFYEPELIELGENQSQEEDSPAEAVQGEPDDGLNDLVATVQKADIEEMKGEREPLVVSNQPSEVKVSPPASQREKEEQRAQSTVKNRFSRTNGQSSESTSGTHGAGGDGVGISGEARGRSFLGCPKPDVALRRKTIVTVNVTIDEEGNVVSASATGGSDATIRKKCEAAALKAKWTPKRGSAGTRGYITFTITPK